MDGVAVRQGVIEPFEDHECDAVAEDCAFCSGVERACVTIRLRPDPPSLVQITDLCWDFQGNAASECHVTFAIENTLAGQM